MERLTWKDESGYYAPKNVTLNVLKKRGELVDRLAAYEDTGLEPEEVKEITSWSYGPFHKKMGDWLKAEQEGRLVVLPCKVGDLVYDIQDGHVLVLTVESIHIWSSGAIRISAHTDKTSMYWKSFELRPEGFGKVFFLNRAEAEAAMTRCVEMDAADAIEELLAKVPTWHPVSEKPTRKNPTHARDTFLVRLESGCIKTLTYEYDNSDRCRPGMSPLFDEGWAKTVVPVTHWMELPKFEPPKGGNHDN